MLTGPLTVKNVLKPKKKGKLDLNCIERGLVFRDSTRRPKTVPGEQLETHTASKNVQIWRAVYHYHQMDALKCQIYCFPKTLVRNSALLSILSPPSYACCFSTSVQRPYPLKRFLILNSTNSNLRELTSLQDPREVSCLDKMSQQQQC